MRNFAAGRCSCTACLREAGTDLLVPVDEEELTSWLVSTWVSKTGGADASTLTRQECPFLGYDLNRKPQQGDVESI